MTRSSKNFAIFLLTTTLFSGVSRSSSADPPKLPKELEGKVSVLKKGQRAPISGILLTRVTLVHLMKAYEKRVRTAEAAAEKTRRDAAAELDAARKRGEAEVSAEKSRTSSCLSDALRRERIYETALARGTPAPSFWTSPVVVGTIGVLVGGGICAGTAAATR